MADQGSIANLKQNINENIVQNTTKEITGTKMNTVLNNIVDTLNFNGRDFFNVNEYREKSDEYADAAAGRAAVPDEEKKLGLVITYLLADGWYIDQFIGSNISGWGTASNWKAIGPVSVSQNTETGQVDVNIGGTVNTIISGVDDEPTAGSNNLVKSGGVYKSTIISQETISVPDFLRTAFCQNDTALTFQSGYIKADIGIGKTINLTPQASTGTANYCIVSCAEDDCFFINNVYGGNVSRLYCFIDSSNKVIAVAPPNVTPNIRYVGLVKAPKFTAKVIFQRNNDLGYVYPIRINSKIDKKDCPIGSNAPYINDSGYHIGSFLVIRNNGVETITPANVGDVLSPSYDGFIVYNYTTNRVRFERWTANLSLTDYILEFYYSAKNIYYGGSLSDRHNAGIALQALEKTTHIFDLYTAVDASFSNNSITLSYCRGILNNNITLHELKVDGVRTTQTFTFTENGYLVYNAKTFSARFSTSYTDITEDEFVWIYFLNGSISGGLLYQNYLDYKSSLQVTATNTIYKRAQQLFSIKWNAKNTIPTPSSATGISIGEHTGIPYTSCMEVDKFVGYDVSLETFMTAVNNPYSLIYTEDLRRNVSGYGFTYHGNRATIGGYMGIVCNIFALYSTCYPIPYDSGNFDYMRRIGVIKKLSEQDFKNVEIGDVIWEPGHCNVIIDVDKDENGNVIGLKWAESVQDFPIVNTMTTAQANARLVSNGGIIYRYIGVNKYMFYDKSPFVATLGESIEQYSYNNDICTFAGNRASFRKGQIIYLNYNLAEVGNWTSIELYRGNTLIDTLTIDTSLHKIDLTSLNLDYGKYKARMKYNDTYSDYTYFEIIETEVSLSYNGSNMIVSFDSANGHPDYIRLCKIDGGPICIIPITEENVSNGVIEFNPQFFINRQGYSSVSGGTYLKVHFSGEYGGVTNEPILTTL